jgi:hypothetical protein
MRQERRARIRRRHFDASQCFRKIDIRPDRIEAGFSGACPEISWANDFGSRCPRLAIAVIPREFWRFKVEIGRG